MQVLGMMLVTPGAGADWGPRAGGGVTRCREDQAPLI
jgi:hypothetical protein